LPCGGRYPHGERDHAQGGSERALYSGQIRIRMPPAVELMQDTSFNRGLVMGKSICVILILVLASASRPALSSELAPADATAPVLLAPGVVSTNDGEFSPVFDSRRGQLFFMRRTPGRFDYTIYTATLSGGEWSPAGPAPFSGDHRDAAPMLSPDGQTIFFDSRRPSDAVAGNSINIWRTDRAGDGWSEPTLVAGVSRNAADEPEAGLDEFGPAIDAAGRLWVYSFRRPFRAGRRYVAEPPDYATVAVDDSIPDPSAATFVSYLYVSPDGRTALMEGRGDGGSDIYYACRYQDRWRAAKRLPRINSPAADGGPALSSDGRYVLFVSNRESGNRLAGNASLYAFPTASLPVPCE
jgi:hypothetical protein